MEEDLSWTTLWIAQCFLSPEQLISSVHNGGKEMKHVVERAGDEEVQRGA